MLNQQRLDANTDAFHQLAAEQWRETGQSSTTLAYLPEHGEPTLQILPTGALPTARHLARRARELRAQALILTSEAWVAPLASAAMLDLPPADRPRPSEQAERYPVIVTVAVRTDGLTVLRESRIADSAFGRTITPGHLEDPGPREHGIASHLREALTRAHRN